MPESVSAQHLSDLLTEEIANALRLPRSGPHMGLLRPVVRGVTRKFAALAAAFDADIAALGWHAAATRFAAHFVAGVSCEGCGIPTEGPVLIAANHPGVSDALAIAHCIPRDDVCLTLSDVPIVRALPHAQGHFIPIPGHVEGHVAALRQIVRALEAGRAVIIFPSTHLTPDPAAGAEELAEGRTTSSPYGQSVDPAAGAEGRAEGRTASSPYGEGEAVAGFEALARATFDDWSASVLLALRRVPACRLQVAMVSGVTAARFAHHPLTRLIRAPRGWERQRLAEFLQVMGHLRTESDFGLAPRVVFGAPLTVTELGDLRDHETAMARVVAEGRGVLAYVAQAGSTLAHRQGRPILRR